MTKLLAAKLSNNRLRRPAKRRKTAGIAMHAVAQNTVSVRP